MQVGSVARAKTNSQLGRPRDKNVHRKILDTTLVLLKTHSLRDLTIESIAKTAGVSKVTIYRWWQSKAQLVIEAFMEAHLVRTPMQRELPPGERLAKHIRMLTEQYADFPGQVVAQIVADGQYDTDTLRAFRELFHYGRRAVVREVLDEWRSSGEIDPEIRIEALMDLLYAPVYMRLLLGHAPLNRAFVEHHIRLTYTLLGAKVPSLD